MKIFIGFFYKIEFFKFYIIEKYFFVLFFWENIDKTQNSSSYIDTRTNTEYELSFENFSFLNLSSCFAFI